MIIEILDKIYVGTLNIYIFFNNSKKNANDNNETYLIIKRAHSTIQLQIFLKVVFTLPILEILHIMNIFVYMMILQINIL